MQVGNAATAVVVFTRDLRLNDHPALTAALRTAHKIVPLFVLDSKIAQRAAPNRLAFLQDSLQDLDHNLRRLGGELILRHGPWVTTILAVAKSVQAEAIFMSADVSALAQRRQNDLLVACQQERIALNILPGITVIPPTALTVKSTGGNYKVFTPYLRAWQLTPRRPQYSAPTFVKVPEKLDTTPLQHFIKAQSSNLSPRLLRGGETVGRKRMNTWLNQYLEVYAEQNNNMGQNHTSQLSAYLHFGCISPLELVNLAAQLPISEAYVRQVCWRDFYHQLCYGTPTITHQDYRKRKWEWSTNDDDLEAWKAGHTGYPIIDAAMRQLKEEGFMHNRARLLVASFLTKDLNIHWQHGAKHFNDWLVDGDIASNYGNWQWVAGTGTDTRPNRIFNPTRQAERFDADGNYIRRYLPELAGLQGKAIHQPWQLGLETQMLDYPTPIVNHAVAAKNFQSRVAAK